MRIANVLLGALLTVYLLGCVREKSKEVVMAPSEQRLKALYAEQDALYAGRYGRLDALTDISNGTPKLLWHGLFRTHDQELIAILKKRFSVQAQFVAGCEASPVLVNYADAYNAEVMQHLAQEFGVSAYDEAEDSALSEHRAKLPEEANQPSQPMPLTRHG